jgi:hypothetical protein
MTLPPQLARESTSDQYAPKKEDKFILVSGQLEIVAVILSGISFAQPSTPFIA